MKKFHRAILHVGPDKTGSSSIQSACVCGNKLLSEHGVCYPLGNQHHAGLGSCLSKNPEIFVFNVERGLFDLEQIRKRDEAYMVSFLKELEISTADVLVLSYEGFVSLEEEALVSLREFIAEFADSYEVVFYARSPLSYAPSAMSQRVKSGSLSWPNGQPPIFENRHKLEMLVRVFGKEQLNVRKFSRDALPNGDVVMDFLSLLDLPASVKQEVAGFAVNENQGLSKEALLIGERIINLLGDKVPAAAEFYGRFEKLLSSIKGEKIRLNPEQILEVSRVTKEETEYLADEFGVTFAAENDEGLQVSPLISSSMVDSIGELLLELVSRKKSNSNLAIVMPVSTMAPNEQANFGVIVTNQSSQIWESPINLSYHWLTSSGDMCVFDGKRSKLPKENVIPGEELHAQLLVEAPSKAGRYILVVTLVQEGIGWFENNGFDAGQMAVDVIEPLSGEVRDELSIQKFPVVDIRSSDNVDGQPPKPSKKNAQELSREAALIGERIYHLLDSYAPPADEDSDLPLNKNGINDPQNRLTTKKYVPTIEGISEKESDFDGQESETKNVQKDNGAERNSVASTDNTISSGNNSLEPVEIGCLMVSKSVLSMVINQRVTVEIIITNHSGQLWTSEGIHPINLSYHWLKGSGEIVDFNGRRTRLPAHGVLPNQTLGVDMLVFAPKEVGSYILVLTLVQEGIGWLENKGFKAAELSVDVVNQSPEK